MGNKGKKAAIELSMNFMVVIILAIVILGMGVYLAVRAFNQANDLNDRIDRQTEEQIFSLLDSGESVVAPLNTAEIKRGDNHVFWVGVRNLEPDNRFKVVVEGVKLEGITPDDEGCDSTLLKNIKFLMKPVGPGLYESSTQLVRENERTTFSVILNVPRNSKRCEYAINARVYKCADYSEECEPGDDYGTMQKLYVTVI